MSLALAAWSRSGIARRLLITLGLLAAFRVGAGIPAPGVDAGALRACLEAVQGGGAVGVANLLSGGALLQLAVFALGVMPYITASIAVQMLGSTVGPVARLRQAGPEGQARLSQYTRFAAAALSGVQAAALAATVTYRPGTLYPGCGPVVTDPGVPTLAVLALTLVAGSLLCVFLGELITAHGVGNGLSLLILASVVAALPGQVHQMASQVPTAGWGLAGLGLLLLVAAVVFVEQAAYRVPVVYATHTPPTGAAGAPVYLPLRLNQAGIVPAIIASAVLSLPVALAGEAGEGLLGQAASWLVDTTGPVYLVAYAVVVAGFCFFQLASAYDPDRVADQLRHAGAFIPGLTPGDPTSDFLDRVTTRLTAAGAVYLVWVALLPALLLSATVGVGKVPLGGTTVLICVAVALATTDQLTSGVARPRFPTLKETR